MRIGIFASDDRVDRLVTQAQSAEADGLDGFWVPQIFSVDAMSALTLIGHQVPRLELGTAVVPTWPRHPLVTAGQALTTQAASNGRFTLGIGLSHQPVVEGMFGMSFTKPLGHMREYLEALIPLLDGETVNVAGESVTAAGAVTVGDAPLAPPVLIAALGPQMLRLAAERTTGTITWMTGLRTLGDHTVPTITAEAERAGTPAPRVVAALPVAVTDDVDGAKQRAAQTFKIYGQLPSYAAMIEREGADGPADVALIGSADHVASSIRSLADAGVTDFVGAEFARDETEAADTRAVLVDLVE